MFPSLPSGGNAALSSLDGGSGLTSLLTRIATAAHQKEVLAAQKARQDKTDAAAARDKQFANEESLRKNGAIPAMLDENPATRGPADPTMPPEEDTQGPWPNPKARGAGVHVIEPISKREYYFQTKEELAEEAHSNYIAPPGSPTEKWLQENLGMKPGTPIPLAHVGAVTGLGKAMLDAAEKAKGKWKTDTSGKFSDAAGNPAAFQYDEENNKVRPMDLSGFASAPAPAPGASPDGPFTAPVPQASAQPAQPAQRGAAPGGGLTFKPPEKPEKEPRSENENDWVRIITDPASDPKDVKRAQAALDLRQKMTPAQLEGDKDRHLKQAELGEAAATRRDAAEQRRADAKAVLENKAAKDHEAAGLKKDAMQSMAQGFYDAEGTNPGETYFPPRYVNGIVVPGPATMMPSDKDQMAERKKALHTAGKGFDKTAATHQAEQKRIEQAHGWGQQAAPAQTAQPTAAPAAPKPAQPVAAPAAAAAAQPAQRSAAPAVAEGAFIRNPKTGERRTLKGGQWIPAPAK